MDPLASTKLALRDQMLAGRRRRGPAELVAAARGLADVLVEAPEVRRAATVAAYVSVGSEPGTGPLLESLRAAGKRVVLPVLLPDNDLDWAVLDGPPARARRGLLEPTGPRLGVDHIAAADVVLVPALAVDGQGNRLGRGGGSYDRALARVPIGTFVCALLHADDLGVELVDSVPVGPWDRPVTAAATQHGITRFRGPGAT